MLTDIPIGIVGAGIAGLSLAITLQKNGIKSIIFEKDEGFHSRHQGYGLTLQQGGKIFDKLDLLKEVQSKCVLSNCHYIFNQNGELILGWGSFEKLNNDSSWNSKYICHLARQDLRECFINELDPNFVTMKWKCEVEAYSDHKLGVNIHLKNESTTVLVKCVAGCDGIYSQVRQALIPNSSLTFLNTFVMLGIVESNPTFTHRVLQMSDGKSRIFCMPFNKASVMWQLSFPMDSALKFDKSELKELALNKCRFFHSTILDIIKQTSVENITGYPVYDRDPISLYDFPKNSKITLLGDAAHPMSPFKGQGANQALLDALSFAKNLLKYNVIEDAIHSYQLDMISRTKSKVLGSREAVGLLHLDDFVYTEYQLKRMHYNDVNKHLLMYKNMKNQGLGIWNVELIDGYLNMELNGSS
eukprot:NODE_173_length_15916_cov_0.397673.p3 type:complete len:414 gc:universal NODE_173_length_15916_cov_0.397673:11834-10593(-)